MFAAKSGAKKVISIDMADIIDKARLIARANKLDNGDCFEGEPSVTDGTLPDTVHVLCVEFVKMLGTATTISVTVSGEIFAVLDPGQSVVIPMEMGEAIADCKIHTGHFTNGTREATVNVMVSGV